MRSAEDMGYPIVSSHLYHFKRFLDAFRPVVEAWQNVAMNVDKTGHDYQVRTRTQVEVKTGAKVEIKIQVKTGTKTEVRTRANAKVKTGTKVEGELEIPMNARVIDSSLVRLRSPC